MKSPEQVFKMKISELKKQEEARFNELALIHGSIFNTSEWAALFGDKARCYGIYNRGNELMGGFITYAEKKFGLSIYRNPPYTPIIGPFVEIRAENPVAVMDTMKEVLFSVAGFMDGLPYAILTYSLDPGIIDMQPFIWKKFRVSPNFSYVLDLSESEEQMWKRMSNERRKNVNKGMKDGLVTDRIHDLDIVRSLALKSFGRQRKKSYEEELSKILFEFALENNSFAFATFSQGKPISCIFCIFDRRTAYYIAGGFDSDCKHHGAGVMAMWEAIKFAKKLGLRYFDFEGSMSPDIEKYFRGFGGTLTPYYQINKAKLPLEFILKLYKREFF